CLFTVAPDKVRNGPTDGEWTCRSRTALPGQVTTWRRIAKGRTTRTGFPCATNGYSPGLMIRDFFAGVGLLLRGFGIVFRTPRLLLLGALPALVTGGLLLGLVITLGVFAPDLVALVTPFADGWDATYRELFRDLVDVALVVALIYFGLLLFAAATLA